ncbi:hypothetical protein FO519_000342 [Halicephalobus sp. NKZ332]|nr:hypothetical protein FO519_000342 [Halicephalobus sp. NKZ332]
MIKLFFLIALYVTASALDGTYDSSNDFDEIDSNNDGGISLPEFLKWRGARGLPKEIRLFKSYDANYDGHLSVSEFVPLVYALSKTPASEGTKLFSLLDLDHDGSLTKSEVEKSKEKIPAEITNGIFQFADINSDGKITLKEFINVVDSDAIVEQSKNTGTATSLLTAMDTNGDKKIDKDEVRTFTNKFNRVSEAELNTAFKLLDLNEDNALTVTELEKLPDKITELAGIRPMPVIQN